MSVASIGPQAASGATGDEEDRKANAGRLWVVAAIVAVSAILSGFYAIDEYAAGTGAAIKTARDDAGDFQSVFQDLMQARFRVLGLAADVMLQDRTAMEAFAKNDRAALVARIEPFFAEVRKNHNLEQLNFWTPPAKLFYRAGKPNEVGVDVSRYRRTIVAASERQERVLAVETGISGHVDVRAIVPVVFDGKFVGTLELASNFDVPLERASEVSGLKWALGITRESSDRVERPADPKIDSWQKDEVFFRYADPDTAHIMHLISFDPGSKTFALVNAKDRTIFVKSFPVIDFAGAPSITIAILRDLTDTFSAAMRTAVTRSLIAFVALSVIGSFAYVRFGQIRQKLTGMVGRQRKELEERVAFCDAAVARLKEVDLIKRGFFTNLVTAVNEPLQAVAGQLAALVPAADKAGDRAISDRLNFALAETTRLSRLVEDYQQVELFRQRLVKSDAPLVSLNHLVGRAIDEDLAVDPRRRRSAAPRHRQPGGLRGPALRTGQDRHCRFAGRPEVARAHDLRVGLRGRRRAHGIAARRVAAVPGAAGRRHGVRGAGRRHGRRGAGAHHRGILRGLALDLGRGYSRLRRPPAGGGVGRRRCLMVR